MRKPSLKFKRLTQDIKIKLDDKSGIYAIYYGDICLYVGATIHLRLRLLRFFGQTPKTDTDYFLSSLIEKIPEMITFRVYFTKEDKLTWRECSYTKELRPLLHRPFKPYTRKEILSRY